LGFWQLLKDTNFNNTFKTFQKHPNQRAQNHILQDLICLSFSSFCPIPQLLSNRFVFGVVVLTFLRKSSLALYAVVYLLN
jgi:hypothetical protein